MTGRPARHDDRLGRAFLKALALFIGIVGLVLVAAVAVPQYRNESRRRLAELAAQASRRLVFADFYPRQLDEKTAAIVSRTQMRDDLARYDSGAMGLDGLRASSRQKYRDGLSAYAGLVGAIRYAADGNAVAETGNYDLLPFVPADAPEWADCRIVRVHRAEAGTAAGAGEGRPLVESRRQIVAEGKVLGEDALLFDASEFNATLGAITFRISDGKTGMPRAPAGMQDWRLEPTSFPGVALAYSWPAAAARPDPAELLLPIIFAVLALAALLGAVGYLTVYRVSRRILDEARSLAERREMMIRETNHRVKNNLAILSVLLEMHADKEGPAEVLADMRSRIDRITLVHDHLYRTPVDEPLALKQYLSELLDATFSAHAVTEGVDWMVEGDEVTLPDRACSDIGFIVSELAINAIKYGVRAGKAEGRSAPDSVRVVLSSGTSGWSLVFSNTGRPFPEDVDPLSSSSFGMELVRSYAGQVGARLSFRREPVTEFRLDFPNP